MELTRLKELRTEKNMKQSDVAKLLNLSPSAISNYEQGIREMDAESICKLCEIFNCTADYVLGRSFVPSSELSVEEGALVAAWRKAPKEIRAIINTALAPYRENVTKSSTA